MNYRLPNVGRSRSAIEHANTIIAGVNAEVQRRQLAAGAAGRLLNQRASLVVQCGKDDPVCRVFVTTSGQLFTPLGDDRETRPQRSGGRSLVVWDRPPPYWIGDCDEHDEVRTQCRCCRDLHVFPITAMTAHLEAPAGRKRMRCPHCVQ